MKVPTAPKLPNIPKGYQPKELPKPLPPKAERERKGIFGHAGDYALGEWGTFGGRLRGLVDKYVPTFSNMVRVRVYCAPRGALNDANFVALSTAFGMVKNLNYFSSNQIQVSIDYTNKMVEVMLSYESNGLNTSANLLGSAALTTGKDIIQSGVPDTIKGATWPNWLKKTVGSSPELPLVGKVIATHRKTDATTGNPNFGANLVPRLDGMSRDIDLTEVVAAALMAGPCASPAKPTTTSTPSVPPTSLTSVGTDGDYIPSTGGIDTNRWTNLASVGATSAMPTWKVPSNYQYTDPGQQS